MKRDIKKMKKATKGNKIITKHEWIIQTLSTMNEQDPKAIGLSPNHLDILKKSLLVDPNNEITPYQSIIEKFSKEHQAN